MPVLVDPDAFLSISGSVEIAEEDGDVVRSEFLSGVGSVGHSKGRGWDKSMFSRARRGTGQGGPRLESNRRRPPSKALVGVEPLEGRTLLSYLVVVKNHKVIPVHTGDARVNEPLFSNGIAVKHALHFYPLYTGPKQTALNGVQATARITGNLNNDGNLILSGTVAGPIIQRPTTASQEAVYTFGIDRGGASRTGPFPGRRHIRFDTVVVAVIRRTGISAYYQLSDPSTNQPGRLPQPTTTPATLGNRIIRLSSSSVRIQGNTITITVPLLSSTGANMLTSSGKAIDQWNVNFFTRFPNQKPDFHSVASLTPEFTDFQVFVRKPTFN
jgi:hypothetical protein